MGPKSWQNRLKDAFSGLNSPSYPPRDPSVGFPGYGSPPPSYYTRSVPPIPPRPSPPVPQRPSRIVFRGLKLLEVPIIEAELVLPSGQVVLRRQNLDIDLGNDNGTFSFGDRNFSKSARNVYVHDNTLYAELATRDGEFYPDKVGIEVDIPDDLRLYDIAIRTVEYHASHSPQVPNDRSRLAVSPQEDIHSLRLISDFVLAAECRQSDGTWATSYANLNAHISNDFGVFKRGGRDFSSTSDDIRLSGTTLTAKLGNGSGEARERTIDMSRIFRCENGRLVPYNVRDPLEVPAAVHDPGIPDKSPLSGCRSAHLVGRNILVARCVLRGGKSKEVAYDLDTLFGIVDDRLRPFGHDFHTQSQIEEVKLHDSTLHVHLKETGCQTVNLDEFLAHVNGRVVLKEEGPCHGCSKAFRANRLYGPMGDPHRERLNFNLRDVNPACALCKIIESIINSIVPFIRSCEVHLESSSDYFGKFPIRTVELQISVNNIDQKYRLYLEAPTTSKAYEMMPMKEHSDAWFQPSQRWPFITSLIDDCFHNHENCERRGRPFLPSRCLDIGLTTDDGVKVIHSSNEIGRYACLSHCWGSEKTCQLTSETFARYTAGVHIDALPKTYRDAISVCRNLGLRYLWIDSLCILQDSKADWQFESPKMIKYYGQCYVCIAATNVSGANSGIDIVDRPGAFHQSGIDHEGVQYDLVAYPSELVELVPHFSRADKMTVQERFPLMTRAWVLQERWLAPRTLHFCGREVVFECTEGLKCECGHAEDDFTLPIGDEGRVMELQNIKDGVVLKRRRAEQVKWTQFVSAYSSLNLTFGTDHLPAISGLARDFSDRRVENPPGTYLAGHWSNTLHEELVWFVGEPLLSFRDRRARSRNRDDNNVVSPIAQNSKMEKYVAPSWSWASVFETIRYRAWDDESTLQCEIIDAFAMPDGTDEYGAVAPGCSITVRGRLSKTGWSMVRGDNINEYVLLDFIGTQRLDRYEAPGIRFLPDYTINFADSHQLSTSETLYVFPIVARGVHLMQWVYNMNDKEAVEKELEFAGRVRNKQCLVLRKVLNANNSMPSYERVGFTEFASIRAGVENEDHNLYVDETFMIL